ncbi:MAG: FtsQ-type POTRA domain-containing protein [Clostridiales bacterium]|nr:FtsQ-type POTRA domain-containing protein [Clostridiales bacterium]
MATVRKHKRKERRSSQSLFRIYILLSVVLIVAAVVAGSLVFFKAHSIQVEGNERYTEEELLAAADIEEGTNLFQIPRREIETRMAESLPYLKEVSIQLIPPETVVIQVTETEPAAAVESDGEIWYIDYEGKLLERVEESGDYPTVTGLTLLAPSAGTNLAVSEEDSLKEKGLLGLLAALTDGEELSRVASIDLSDSATVTMLYDGRLRVKMGLNDDFDYDLKMLQAAHESYIDENWSDTDTGELDMTKTDVAAALTKD